MKNIHLKIIALSFFALSTLGLSACESIKTEARYPTGYDRKTSSTDDAYAGKSSIFGKGGIKLLGGKDKDDDERGSGIGVNAHLWRASLDTVSFMPLASADPFGGVILTDWYAPEETPNERFKVNVFIMGRELRSDGVRVRVFKQAYKEGTWRDIKASDDTDRQMEDAILTRARQLRVSQLSGR